MNHIASTMIGSTFIFIAGLGMSGLSSAGEAIGPSANQGQSIGSDTATSQLPDGLYEYFHDSSLHKPDGLGDYSEDFRLVKKTAPRADIYSAVAIQRETLASMYEYFHNPELHKPDGLGSYAQNFRVAYPN